MTDHGGPSGMKLIYLTCPYTHDDPEIRKLRVLVATQAAARIMEVSEAMVFSPLTHNHSIMEVYPLVPGHDFWMPRDLRILRVCDELAVLMLSGCTESKGVAEEVSAAKAVGIPVRYYHPAQLRVEDVEV